MTGSAGCRKATDRTRSYFPSLRRLGGFFRTSASREPLGVNALAIALFTAVSTILLAWSASLCLSGVTHKTPQEEQRFTILVSGSAKAPANGTLITRLLADGKALRRENTELKGAWVSYWDRTLSHPDTLESASISFNARSAVILFDRLGHCGNLSIYRYVGSTREALGQNRREAVWQNRREAVWNDRCERGGRYMRFVAVDLPAPTRWPRGSFVAWLIVFVVLAAAIRPWMRRPRLDLWLLMYLATLHLLFWATQPVGLLTDSLKQLPTLDTNFLHGMPAYFPPGYPILVGLGYLVSRTFTGSAITLLQHIMMIATIWWSYRLLERCAGTTISFATALIIGGAAPTLVLPQGLLSENVALFGMMGALYFAFNYREHGRIHDGILAGSLLAWATLARVIPYAAALPAMLAIMIGAEPRAIGLRRFSAVAALVIVILAMPILWFGIRSGNFALSNSVGRHLYNRVITDQCLLDKQAPATSRLLKLIAPLNPYGVPHWKIQNLLELKGLTDAQVEALMKRTALEGIHLSPWKYLSYSLQQTWIQYFLNPVTFMPYASTPFEYDNNLESSPLLQANVNSLLWRKGLEDAFGVAWRYIPWIALASIPLIPMLKERATFAAFALIPTGYILSTALAEYLLSRYNAAIVPFVIMLAGGTFAAVISVASRFARIVASCVRRAHYRNSQSIGRPT
jgi:Dolichyl-phosphate-mannose-protein mannosyltransferase